MSTQQKQRSTSEVLDFLHEWDRSGDLARSRMLSTFLKQNSGKSCELEKEFAQVSSLFLARLSTWMRLTYMCGTFLGLQLKAIHVFLSASCSHQYLTEFLEDGCVLTLLDVLGQNGVKEEDKAEALRLLETISDAGYKYKEIICECHAVVECLAKSHAEETQEMAQALLESLTHGNPKYQSQIYRGLITIMSCTSTKAQQLALRTLRIMQSKMKTVDHTIVEPLLNVLRSLRVEVQYEAINLILDLRRFELRPVLLSGLVALLKPNRDGAQRHQILEDPDVTKMMASLPVFVQQAAAAKALHLLAQSSEDIGQELLSLQVVHHLLCAMANRDHAESQTEASLALKYFVDTNPAVKEGVLKGMGSALFGVFMQNSDAVHKNIDEIQAEILLSNKVNISEGLDDKSRKNSHCKVISEQAN